MPILKVKNKETGQWEQVGVSTEATGAQIAAHNVAPDAHQDIRQAISQLASASAAIIEAQEGNTKFVVSTEDLEDGVSPLADDTLYLVYE
jgi:hypothetical protein